MYKHLFFALALGCTSALAWEIQAKDIDDWGLVGITGISGPESDYFSKTAGGTSQVLDQNDNCVGACGTAIPNDVSDDIWKLTGLLNNDRISMKFKVTNYMTSTASGWGWAYAGYIMGPILDETKTDPNLGVFGRSKPMGLTTNDSLYYKIKYTAGKKITLQLFAATKSDGSLGYDSSAHGSPSLDIIGNGAEQTGTIAVSKIKYMWGTGTPDYSLAVGLGFLRKVFASTQGAAFPTTEPTTTLFDFMCVSNEPNRCWTSTTTTITGGTIAKLYYNGSPYYSINNLSLGLGDTTQLVWRNTGVLAIKLNGQPYLSGSDFSRFGISAPQGPTTINPNDSITFKVWGTPKSNNTSYADLYIPTTGRNFSYPVTMDYVDLSNPSLYVDGTHYNSGDTVNLGSAGSWHRLSIKNNTGNIFQINGRPTFATVDSALFQINSASIPSSLASYDSLYFGLSGPNTPDKVTRMDIPLTSGKRTLYLQTGSQVPTQTTPLQSPIIQGILHLNDGQKAKVWNVQGTQVLEGQGTLDLGPLGPGSWMIQVRDGNHIQSGIYQQF